MKRLGTFLALSALSLGVVAPPALADQVPPAGSKPLSQILHAIESQGLGRISEAEFEHGVWEVKACTPTACQKLDVDPRSGKELRRRPANRDAVPPQGATSISDILKAIEARHLGAVSDIEFEHGSWSIHLNVNPMAVKIGQ